ncbi:tyrosine-type recombinase/integrase [Lactiplantibacillus pentosus]|uniref:tyrosine-type recombinase/integrase n=1 Tax=Lactiplantibacillus pentosus TaxID=1589 RepID=UPI0021A3EEE4|nr:tyrosine-type recombinase/integrase [Lactiplantibacillus pentosus]MCT3308616.1 integrase [Lactiplantibacillus pentosus]
MHYNVEPLRTSQEIDDFLWAVSQARYGERNRMIVLVGINTGLRMSDILRLTVGQVRGKERVMIIEQKTGKKRWLFLKNLMSELLHFTQYRAPSEPLFCSGRGGALTVNGVYRIFQTASDFLERDDIGTHTLRKTFGYHYYQQTHDIASLMMIFNHSSEQVTKRYIGIERDNMEQQLWDFRLGV